MRLQIFKVKFINSKPKLDLLFLDEHDLLMRKGGMLYISEQIQYILWLMNGQITNEEIRMSFKKEYGTGISKKDFINLLRRLKEYDLIADGGTRLLSKLSYEYISQQEEIFKKKKIREPSFAGVCYSNNRATLEKQLDTCFASINMGKFNKLMRQVDRIRGIIVPHSNLELSGSCAAWAYKVLAQKPIPDLFIILAPAHSNLFTYAFSILAKDFRTPLGLVKTERDFIRVLQSNLKSFNITEDCFGHIREHAVEMQLPFLQYIYGNSLEKIRIVTILCKKEPYSLDAAYSFHKQRGRFIRALKTTLSKTVKNVIFIATGDLVHIDQFKPSLQFHKKNKEIINLIKESRSEEFRRSMVDRDRYPTCCRESFYLFFRLLESSRGQVLNYSWSTKSKLISIDSKVQYEHPANIGYVSSVFY